MSDTIKAAWITVTIPSIFQILIFFVGQYLTGNIFLDDFKIILKVITITACVSIIILTIVFKIQGFSTEEQFQNNMVEVLSENFETIDENMTLKDALEAVSEENQNAENEIKKLNAKIDKLNLQNDELKFQLDSMTSADEINKIIQNAAEYWNNSNFAQALMYLKNLKSRSADIEELYKSYSMEYSNRLLSQADAFVSERKSDEAIKLLNEGSDLVFDNKNIENKIREIKEKPKAVLSNLTPVSGTLDELQFGIWDEFEKDNYGNRYSSGIYLKQKYQEKVHLVYALDGKYTSLTGKFVLSESGKNTDGKYIIYFYSLVDGEKKFLDQSKFLTAEVRPIDIDIDVSGVLDLVIEVYDPDKKDNNAWTALVDAKLE